MSGANWGEVRRRFDYSLGITPPRSLEAHGLPYEGRIGLAQTTSPKPMPVRFGEVGELANRVGARYLQGITEQSEGLPRPRLIMESVAGRIYPSGLRKSSGV